MLLDFLTKYKDSLEWITTEKNLELKIKHMIEKFTEDNEVLNSSINALETDCDSLKLQVDENILKLESMNNPKNKLNLKRDEYFILSEKLKAYQYQSSQIDNKLKEYKKLKVSDIELLHRELNSLNKVLESELNLLRDYTTKQTKQVNYYKTKALEAENVINTMNSELESIQNQKQLNLTILPKKSLEISELYKTEIVSSKTAQNYNPKILQSKEDIAKNKELIDDLKSKLDHYAIMNNKLSDENIVLVKQIDCKHEQISELEQELANLKELYINQNN